MSKPPDKLESVINLFVEGVLMANRHNYYWSVGFLLQFVMKGMEVEEARRIWRDVHGDSPGARKDIDQALASLEEKG